MDGERGDGGGGEPEVEDEFACAGILRASLTSMHATVERLFRVAFGIGADDSSLGHNGQIWLKLRGQSSNVKAAKLFVKGVVNQEEQQEVSYPGVLHCVFCGAKGLFMDCLIKSTSAHILVGSPGFLLISGLAEPVVRAYSLIMDLVDRYESTNSGRLEAGERAAGETLVLRRAFKSLVELWEDRHILDLLVLPGSVKEVLLDLVKESGLGLRPNLAEMDRLGGESEDGRDEPPDLTHTLAEPYNPTDRLVEGKAAASKDSASPGARGRAEGAEGRLEHSPQEVEQASGTREEEEEQQEEVERQLSAGNKEFWLLLKFFTAMGYTEDVVKRVLARTGPKEASQILDVVQQEQDRSDQKLKEGDATSRSERNRPCETEHTEDEDPARGDGGVQEEERRPLEGGESEEKKKEDEGHEEDFVFGVLKKAAASCGYTEQKVAEVYNMYPDPSTHQLLLELQREESREAGGLREGPREMDDVVLDKGRRDSNDGWVKVPKLTAPEADLWSNKPLQPLLNQHTPQPETQTPRHILLPEVKGPPTSTYSSCLDPPLNLVTGEQRLLEGLQTPFDLKLTDKPGDAKLRTIVIDGSNVAMSHGRGHFFSCRGIALAVQHFWDRGHRNISALLPQWRQKSHPKHKEQHYLTLLQNLGLLSYTPSREVQGKRISSYDDRLLLQLAQKTDGVIVTNDNLRDLSDESTVWRDIIKRRLLQYTFAGDLFMVPDDPLGRGGPHLDVFLRSDHRTPDPGNHSFAGAATTFPSSKSSRSQTEVLNFRDRTLGGGQDPGSRRGRGHGPGKGWDQPRQPKQHGGAGPGSGVGADRNPEDTASLREMLCQVFPGQDNMVTLVLQCHPAQTDVNVLSDLMLELLLH